MKILLTGGAGYIGSHTYLSLKEAGHDPVILDDFSNSSHSVIGRLKDSCQSPPVVVGVDIRDHETVARVIEKHQPECIIHFAGVKAVGEGEADPLKYYDINVAGTLSLLKAMDQTGVRKLIFSSSATVYGDPQKLPLSEDHPLSATNIYGQTKLIVENMLRAHYGSNEDWAFVILRYFNPVGADPSGNIGENPKGIPNNLMPFITQVAVGKRKELQIFGNDYDTPDGTGVRDYIHVCDLADGHRDALKLVEQPGCTAINLGTGTGYSVLELLKTFEKISGKTIPYKIVEKRPGDVAALTADVSLAKELLNWEASRDLETMCADSWNWQSDNP